MKLKDQIAVGNETIETAKKTYLIALRKYERVKNPILKEQCDILTQFQRIINDRLKHEHKCGCCSPSLYNDAWFTNDGISMRIDADHPNDIIDSAWSWADVEEIMRHNSTLHWAGNA